MHLLLDGLKVGNKGLVQMPNGDSAQITHVGNCSLTGDEVIGCPVCAGFQIQSSLYV